MCSVNDNFDICPFPCFSFVNGGWPSGMSWGKLQNNSLRHFSQWIVFVSQEVECFKCIDKCAPWHDQPSVFSSDALKKWEIIYCCHIGKRSQSFHP